MSGFEIWGVIAGVIGTLEAIANVKERRRATLLNGQPPLETANFRKSNIRAVLETLASSRDLYERRIEAKLQSDDRKNITAIWDNVGKVVQESKRRADQLLAELGRSPVVRREIEVCMELLDSNETTLNTWVGNLNLALQIADRDTPPPSPPNDSQPPEPPVTFDDDPRLEPWIEEGNLEEVKNLLSSSSESLKRDSRIATALLLACRHRRKSIVQDCLSLGADTSLRDDDGLACLHATIGTVDVDGSHHEVSDILNLLLDYNVDPSVPDSGDRGFTPFHYAAETQNLAAIETLYERDKNFINVTDTRGKTALWYACLHQNPDSHVIKYLARKGGDFVDGRLPPLSEKVKSILERDGKFKFEACG